MGKVSKEVLQTLAVLVAAVAGVLVFGVWMADNAALTSRIGYWLLFGMLGLVVVGIFVRLLILVFGGGASYGLFLDKLFRRNPNL